jgi:protein SCO1/2
LIVSMGLGGCHRSAPEGTDVPKSAGRPIAGAEKATPVGETREYKLVGEVKKVDREGREVTIHHEEIPGFMAAMTMPFHVARAEDLEDVRPGDRVEAKLFVELEDGRTRDYRLEDLNVTVPAPATPLVLSLSGSSPRLTTRPRRLEPGEPVPDFAMTDQGGKSFKLSDLRGNVVALTFIYTRCPLPDFCPYMDRKFADLARSIETSPDRARHIRLLSVSFDPEHDTPEVLRKHAQIRGGAPPLWTFAVATHEELGRVMGPLGLTYGPGKNEIIHNLCTAVIDPGGRLARLEVGTQRNKWSSADLLKTIYSLVPTTQK